jgi:hypothetical protein
VLRAQQVWRGRLRSRKCAVEASDMLSTEMSKDEISLTLPGCVYSCLEDNP